MAKEELITFEGLVTEILPDARYRVQLDNGHEVIAYTAGKMKKNRIKTLAGDRVTVEMSPYDLEKGRSSSVTRIPVRRPARGRRSAATRSSAAADQATAWSAESVIRSGPRSSSKSVRCMSSASRVRARLTRLLMVPTAQPQISAACS